jgi:hypothetical protein
VCCALSQIAKHSVDLAEVVVGAEIFPKILTCLKFPDEFVKKHAATGKGGEAWQMIMEDDQPAVAIAGPDV